MLSDKEISDIAEDYPRYSEGEAKWTIKHLLESILGSTEISPAKARAIKVEVENLQAENASLKEQLADLQIEIGKVQREYWDYKGERFTKITNLQSQLSTAQKELRNEQHENAHLEFKLTTLQAQLSAAQGENKRLRGLIGRLADYMQDWGNQEDGIPDEYYNDWVKAKALPAPSKKKEAK